MKMKIYEFGQRCYNSPLVLRILSSKFIYGVVEVVGVLVFHVSSISQVVSYLEWFSCNTLTNDISHFYRCYHHE